MNSLPAASQLFFHDAGQWPLGQITQAGYLRQSAGTGLRHMRVYGQYALVLLVAGQGRFLDALGHRVSLEPGHIILVFPDVAHAYGPQPGQEWDEIYLSFHGPLFDLWREAGMLNPQQPVCRVADLAGTTAEMLSVATSPRPSNHAENLALLGRLQNMAAKWLPAPLTEDTVPPWLLTARSALAANLEMPLDLSAVCRDTGLSYETFRKYFRAATGVSPTQFRLEQRIAAAQNLLLRTDLTHAAVASHLGFQDEAHFSRRFKQVTGQSPRQWKSRQAQT